MKNALRLFIAISCLLGLPSCSKKSTGVPPVSDAKQQQSRVFSQGIGKKATFEAQEKGEVYTTVAPRNQIYLFAFDNASVANKYLAAINAQADYLMRHKGAHVLLAGHTDHRGSREYNVALGERRAKSVQELLQLRGVSKKQIRVVSYGKERPVAFGDDDASDKLNRRVEMTYEAIR